MRIRRVVMKNYRNYADETVEFSPGTNIFLGRNAQGKTNILEAVYYAALGRSHRTSYDEELIRWNENEAKLSVNFIKRDAENLLLPGKKTTNEPKRSSCPHERFDRSRQRCLFFSGRSFFDQRNAGGKATFFGHGNFPSGRFLF